MGPGQRDYDYRERSVFLYPIKLAAPSTTPTQILWISLLRCTRRQVKPRARLWRSGSCVPFPALSKMSFPTGKPVLVPPTAQTAGRAHPCLLPTCSLARLTSALSRRSLRPISCSCRACLAQPSCSSSSACNHESICISKQNPKNRAVSTSTPTIHTSDNSKYSFEIPGDRQQSVLLQGLAWQHRTLNAAFCLSLVPKTSSALDFLTHRSHRAVSAVPVTFLPPWQSSAGLTPCPYSLRAWGSPVLVPRIHHPC